MLINKNEKMKAKEILKKGKLITELNIDSYKSEADEFDKSSECEIEIEFTLNGVIYTFISSWDFTAEGIKSNDPTENEREINLEDFELVEVFSVNEENSECINHDFDTVDQDNLKALLFPNFN